MTLEQIMEYVCQRLGDFCPTGIPQKLSGGLLNCVYLVPGKYNVIYKYYPPFVATAPEIPLDSKRLFIEARALREISPGGLLSKICQDNIRPPKLLSLDAACHCLLMEDVGRGQDLGEWLCDLPKQPELLGSALGYFIAELHTQSADKEKIASVICNDSIQKTRHQAQYQVIARYCRKAGLEDAERIGKICRRLGEKLLLPGRCMIMGDLWPPSLLIVKQKIRIIDWELAHYGHPSQDIGHLLAHLWMHMQNAASKRHADCIYRFQNSFLQSYRRTVGVFFTQQDLWDSSIHFGSEILARTIGSFQRGYFYEGLSVSCKKVQQAVQQAKQKILFPEQSIFFA